MQGPLTVASLAAMIDHSLLRADATDADFDRLCREAVEYGFATVAVNTAPVAYCAKKLNGTGVGVCAAVSFPLGQSPTATKIYEARQAIDEGATEIDFVLNIGRLKSGHLCEVGGEIEAVVKACSGVTTKVILEMAYLTDDEKRLACELAIRAGADFVKTSTGMGPGGATLPDVLLLKSLARGRAKVKAAGGIRNLDQAIAFVDSGVDRLGTSRAVEIITEARDVLPE
ncbi:MAG TPA: deoxyribose-phosphate aldolase [Chloroflexi bacterium]|jgi:deoxyribose-phosphate aldolase|nr:deoxyribose-phosphate aldolase [Chloroflexota bacterium]